MLTVFKVVIQRDGNVQIIHDVLVLLNQTSWISNPIPITSYIKMEKLLNQNVSFLPLTWRKQLLMLHQRVYGKMR